MKALIICPDHRQSAEFARRMRPLALMPVLGRTLLDWWLQHLADNEVNHATVLAADRPDEIRATLEHMDTHGVTCEVISVTHEPSAEAARTQFIRRDDSAWFPQVITLDSLPESPDEPLWTGGAVLFDTLLKQVRAMACGERLTMREVAPGVHVSMRARIAPSAVIEAPAWIGADAIIAEQAHIHPGSIIEEACYIDRHASVHGSWIGPATYVGAFTEVSHSLAWGDHLNNWLTGSQLQVTDDFLLGSLQKKQTPPCRWLTRFFALLLWLSTLPLALVCMLSSWIRRRPALTRRQVVLPPFVDDDYIDVAVYFHALNGVSGIFSRWPELWQVWRGRLHLVGNRPMCPVRASFLAHEFEHLWLDAPAKSGCKDQARAHVGPHRHGVLVLEPSLNLKKAVHITHLHTDPALQHHAQRQSDQPRPQILLITQIQRRAHESEHPFAKT